MIGYRVWKLQPREQGLPELLSLVQKATWHPGVNEAVCLRNAGNMVGPAPGHSIPDHAAPASSCQCGFWCLPTPEEAVSKMKAAMPMRCTTFPPDRGLPLVVGIIRAWGTVIEHDSGSRTGKAQIIGLLKPAARANPNHDKPSDEELMRLVDLAGQAYDVPVVDRAGALVELAW